MRASALRFAVITVLLLVAFSGPVHGWTTAVLPTRDANEPRAVWSPPKENGIWDFFLLVRNTGNTTIQVQNLTVWADRAPLPTAGAPVPTPVEHIPAEIPPGTFKMFSALIELPPGTGGNTYYLTARLRAAEPNGASGWTTPSDIEYGPWSITVERAEAPPPAPESWPFVIGWLGATAAAAVAAAAIVVWYRRRRA